MGRQTAGPGTTPACLSPVHTPGRPRSPTCCNEPAGLQLPWVPRRDPQDLPPRGYVLRRHRGPQYTAVRACPRALGPRAWLAAAGAAQRGKRVLQGPWGTDTHTHASPSPRACSCRYTWACTSGPAQAHALTHMCTLYLCACACPCICSPVCARTHMCTPHACGRVHPRVCSPAGAATRHGACAPRHGAAPHPGTCARTHGHLRVHARSHARACIHP